MLTAGPDGPEALRTLELTHDWGTIPPGDNEALIPYTPPPGKAAQASTIGTFPNGCWGLSVWAGNGIYAQAFNGTGGPAVVGVIRYAIILTDLVVCK